MTEEMQCMVDMAATLNQCRVLLHSFLYSAGLTGTQHAEARLAESNARFILARATRLGLIAAPQPPRKEVAP